MDLNINWDFIIKLFILGVLPWIIQSKKTALSSEKEGINVFAISNSFASLIASSIFISCYYISPHQLINWYDWYVFIFASIVITIIYFLLSLYNNSELNHGSFNDLKEDIKRLKPNKKESTENTEKFNTSKRTLGRLTFLFAVQFLSYILIFISLAFAFIKTSIYKDYTIINEKVIDMMDNKIPNASILLYFADTTKPAIKTKSDEKGSFHLLLDHQSISKIKAIKVTADHFDTLNRIINGEASLMNTVAEIYLNKK